MTQLVDLLRESPLLLLLAVTGLGYLVGRIRIWGFSLGVAAILFVGLGIGALHPDLKLPEIVYQLGLVLFVYTMGLASGPGFFGSFKRRGLRDNLMAVGLLGTAAALTGFIGYLLGLRGPIVAGLFSGSLTNTPALAAVVEMLKERSGGMLGAESEAMSRLLAEPVVGYSLAYPLGVIGVIVAMHMFSRLWRVDFKAEARENGSATDHGGSRIANCDVEITQPNLVGVPVRGIFGGEDKPRLVISRLKRGDRQLIVEATTTFQLGDVVTLVGTDEELERMIPRFGRPSRERPELDRSQLDFRRIFVSSREVAERKIRDLHLQEQFAATITRIKRGDVDLVPTADTVLELGDRVRVVAPRDRMESVTAFFGDSFRHLAEIDIPSVSLGIALGLLVGLIPIPLPGGLVFRLGFAGGPLLVALVLGSLGRTGKVVWNPPYNANLTLRQLGVVLFLAGIGTRAGYAFASTFQELGLTIVLAGAAITFVYSALTLLIGYKVLKMPMAVLIGILSGLQTQPAALAFANEQAESDLPNIGYATVYPTAMVVKIVLAQVLLSLFGWG